MKRQMAAGLLAIPLLLVVLAVLVQEHPASADVDISGQWNIELNGLDLNALPCTGQITQTDTILQADWVCGDVFEVTLTGEIDPLSGRFVMSGDFGGVTLHLDGTASNDSISGNLTKAPFSGTFSGTRILPTPAPTPTPTPPLDISGDWIVSVNSSTSCPLYLVQDGQALSGGIACPFGSARVDGIYNRDHNTLSLTWRIYTDSFALDGAFDGGLKQFSGTTTDTFTGRVLSFNLIPVGDIWGSTSCPPNPAIPTILIGPNTTNRAVDALRLLQAQARLPSSSSVCIGPQDDVNVDGHIDSLDAMLILQREAGLIPRLPVL